MIWSKKIDLKDINLRGKNTLVEHLGIEFVEADDNSLVARMAVDHRTHQPMGIMHGGASCVLAETVGSTAANFVVNQAEYYCVGLDINTNHIKSVKTGYIYGKAVPFHIGKSTHVWGIDIRDEQHKLISVNRLTMAVLKHKL